MTEPPEPPEGSDTGDDAVESAQPEVKTLTFATMRTFLPDYLGEDVDRRIRDRLGPETKAVLEDAQPGAWVAESHMQELMRCIYYDALEGEDEAYLEFARALAATGISRFMKIFLSLASARFVLRKIPVVWARLRRNAGHVTAEVESDTVRLHYTGFPFFGDHVYRMLSLANCQALVFAATKRIPAGKVVQWSADSLVLEFDLTAAPESTPSPG